MRCFGPVRQRSGVPPLTHAVCMAVCNSDSVNGRCVPSVRAVVAVPLTPPTPTVTLVLNHDNIGRISCAVVAAPVVGAWFEPRTNSKSRRSSFDFFAS